MRYSDVFIKRNAPYTPPSYLLQDLYNLDDGRLRLRWSEDQEKWCLERKELCGVEYIKSLPATKINNGRVVENDSWVRARDGYILCGYFDPMPHLGSWVIRNLQYFNIRRMGGAQRAELELVRQEEKRQRDLDRLHSAQLESVSKEFWNEECWRQGERAAVPAKYGEISK